MACSLTAKIDKIESDIQRTRQALPGLRLLLFYTPHKVSEQTKERWVTNMRREYGIDLVVLSREDIITDLMSPKNASLCESILRIPLAHEPELTDVIERTRSAISEVVDSWFRTRHLTASPFVELSGVRLDDQGKETRTLLATTEIETVCSAKTFRPGLKRG